MRAATITAATIESLETMLKRFHEVHAGRHPDRLTCSNETCEEGCTAISWLKYRLARTSTQQDLATWVAAEGALKIALDGTLDLPMRRQISTVLKVVDVQIAYRKNMLVQAEREHTGDYRPDKGH